MSLLLKIGTGGEENFGNHSLHRRLAYHLRCRNRHKIAVISGICGFSDGHLLGVMHQLFTMVPDWQLRQLLVQLLWRLPVQSYREEDLADLVQFVKVCRSPLLHLWDREIEILDQHSKWLAEPIREAGGIFSRNSLQIEARLREMFSSDAEELPEDYDGPTPDGGFIWQGKDDYRFSQREWQLLSFLWDEGPVEEEEIRNHLHISSNALAQLQHKTQKKLDAYQLPFKIHRPGPLVLRLDPRPLTRR
jgi:hypothetical protein